MNLQSAGRPRKLRVALSNVNPNPADFFITQIRNPHIGLSYLSAEAKQAGFEVDLWDAYSDPNLIPQLERIILEGLYDVIGFTTYEHNIDDTLALIKRLRGMGCSSKIILGGYQATFVHQEIFERYGDVIDYVLLGEADYSFVSLLELLAAASLDPAVADLRKIQGLVFRSGATTTVTAKPALINDLNCLPRPDFRRLNTGEVQIIVSRGCTANCSFCSIKAFYRFSKGRGIRIRSVESVVSEIRDRITEFKTNRFLFVDDELFALEAVERGWIARFVDRVEQERLHIRLSAIKVRADSVLEYQPELALLQKLGVGSAFVGIETMDDYVLSHLFNKRTTEETNRRAILTLKGMEIVPSIGLIPFHPYTTLAELEKNFLFYRDTVGVKNWLYLFHRYNKLIVFPGTDRLIRILRKDNLLDDFGLGRYGWKYRDPNMEVIYRVFKQWDAHISPCLERVKTLAQIFTRPEPCRDRETKVMRVIDSWVDINNAFVNEVFLRAREVLPHAICIDSFRDIIAKKASEARDNLDIIPLDTDAASSTA